MDISKTETNLIKTIAAKRSFVGFCTAEESKTKFKHKWKKLAFGCESLDRLTNDGLSGNGLTEIFGESGSGKSQICLQLSLNVQLPVYLGGFNKGAIYICTEGKFPSNRLYQMIDGFKQKYIHKDFDNINFGDNVFVQLTKDIKEFLVTICNKIPILMKSKKIGLIVIDSIGAIFRTETDYISRANEMRIIAHKLLELSNEHHCSIVVVNQVRALMDEETVNSVVPCFGLAWSHLVDTRIQISRTNSSHLHDDTYSEESSVAPIPIRKFDVIFSPYLPQESAEFVVTSDGIMDVLN